MTLTPEQRAEVAALAKRASDRFEVMVERYQTADGWKYKKRAESLRALLAAADRATLSEEEAALMGLVAVSLGDLKEYEQEHGHAFAATESISDQLDEFIRSRTEGAK
jgi:hypothetical protein